MSKPDKRKQARADKPFLAAEGDPIYAKPRRRDRIKDSSRGKSIKVLTFISRWPIISKVIKRRQDGEVANKHAGQKKTGSKS